MAIKLHELKRRIKDGERVMIRRNGFGVTLGPILDAKRAGFGSLATMVQISGGCAGWVMVDLMVCEFVQ